MNLSESASTHALDGFNAVMSKLRGKAMSERKDKTFSFTNLSNGAIDTILQNKQLLLRQIEIPALMATKFYPTINSDYRLKVKKIQALLRKDRWLLKLQSAIALANRYGAAYIVLTTVGEKDLSLPLKLGAINSTCLHTQQELEEHRQLELGINYLDPEYYILTTVASQQIIHASRVLAFYGKRRTGYELRHNNYRHMPIWLPSYDLYVYYEAALEASIAMLKDSSVGVYKMKGLVKALRNAKTQDSTNKLEQDIYRRISSLLDGMSILNKIVIDAEDEEFEFIERNYANVEKIVSVFKTAFAEVCDLPSTVLFSSNVDEGLFSNVGLADRQLMASNINSYQTKYLTPVFDTLIACFVGSYDLEYQIEYPSTIELTEGEKSELFYKISQSHTSLIASGVVSPQTVAKRYQSEVIDASLNLTDEEVKIASGVIPSNIVNNAAEGEAKGGSVGNQNTAGFTHSQK
ncbi:MAG: hypothetical protein RLZZ171_1198 [Cyanobacteriota bacterium]|jgi:phage-related protein (TIGR01555 family)